MPMVELMMLMLNGSKSVQTNSKCDPPLGSQTKPNDLSLRP